MTTTNSDGTERGIKSPPVTIGWGTIIRQMVRHACGPARAAEHELAWRYDEACGRHLPLAERAARLREAAQGAPVVVWDMRKPADRSTSRGGVMAYTDGGRYRLICESCRRGGHACENCVFAAEMGGRCECGRCQPRCDNYSPPITCLTAPTSTTGRCDQCRTR